MPGPSDADGTGVGTPLKWALKLLLFNALRPDHQIGAVIRSGEYRPGETAFGTPVARAVFSPSRPTLENNENFREQTGAEKHFPRASGGGDGSERQPSLPIKLSIKKFQAARPIKPFGACCDGDQQCGCPFKTSSPLHGPPCRIKSHGGQQPCRAG